MKRISLFVAILALCALAAAAQDKVKTSDFSGTWILDVSKSQLGERSFIESQTLTVKQTATDLKVETATKRTPPPAMNPSGGQVAKGGFGGGMGGGRMGGGDTPWTYSLGGKDTKGEMSGPMGAIPVTLNAKFDGKTLLLSRVSTFNGQMGEVTMTNKESWSVSDDGKTLTVNAERNGMRGTESSVKVYTRKTEK
jgi:hypothetical protein